MAEKEIIQPLDAEEIKSGIVTKVCESLWDALNKTCNLYQCAYYKFKASGRIELTLDNHPGQNPDPHPVPDIVKFEIELEIPFTPPNVFRRETGQGIPVITENEDGSVEQKAVFYKRERTPRIGRENRDSDL